MMPGNNVSFAWIRAIRFARTSSRTVRRATVPARTASRSSDRVVGREGIGHLNRVRGDAANARERRERTGRTADASTAPADISFPDLMSMLPRPLVYAHRGGAALRPENTLEAFDHGLALGADGLEFDVQLARDGVVVVHHDRTLNRTTDGRGALADRSASELIALDAGHWFRSPTEPA